jgi:hypothetical protein
MTNKELRRKERQEMNAIKKKEQSQVKKMGKVS